MQVTVEELMKKDLKGKVILFQTEKGYQLGCLLNDELAIEKIYAITRRAKKKPFPVLVGSIEAAYALVKYPKRVRPYAQFYWPGPITLVTRKKAFIKDVVCRGLPEVGIWLTEESVAKSIANHFGPLVVANPYRSHKDKVVNLEAAVVFDNTVDYVVKGDSITPKTSFVFDVDNNETLSENYQ